MAHQSEVHGSGQGSVTVREQLLARWLDLTRRVLPDMAPGAGWPIRFDHCFMRVCLDHAIGRPWHEQIGRPAIRHLTDQQLKVAIAVAELIAAEPARLPPLNRQSLAWRSAARQR